MVVVVFSVTLSIKGLLYNLTASSASSSVTALSSKCRNFGKSDIINNLKNYLIKTNKKKVVSNQKLNYTNAEPLNFIPLSGRKTLLTYYSNKSK